MARLVAPSESPYQPDHWLNPAPPTWRNKLTCFLRSHDWVLYAFNHYTLQADLICLRCSRVLVLDLASLTSELQEVGSVEELIEFTHPVSNFFPDDDQIGQH